MSAPNEQNDKPGIRLTFPELLHSKDWKIEIPMLQRDYAQGRSSAKEIRETFISTLRDHIRTGVNIDLDFVYGTLKSEDSSVFVPLDGQQRLTTLFLLHWYLAKKESEMEVFNSIFKINGKSRFAYETRSSSKEFCNRLLNAEVEPQNLMDNLLSDSIKNAGWYYLSWNYDPTIQSMLNMLDEIHAQFCNEPPSFTKLLNTESPLITFQFLNLDSFRLTDDLYIKMNARGKQLTSFENFKAKLEQEIKTLQFDAEFLNQVRTIRNSQTLSVAEYFELKIDTAWANLFWNYKDNECLFDEQLMNFFRVMAVNYLASNNAKKDIIRTAINSTAISFQGYKQDLQCLTPEFVTEVIKTLDLLENGNQKIKKYLNTCEYINEDKLFEAAIEDRLNYSERIRLYALYKFLLRNGNDKNLKDWVRVIFNLTENTIFNDLEEFTIGIQSVDALLVQSTSILEYMSSTTDVIRGFLDLQVQEERCKAKLLLKSEKWRQEVIKYENHPYFKGQISFILDFSGIEESFNDNALEWTDSQDANFFKSFNSYFQKASALFDGSGLKVFPDFCFERALLTKGDYTLSSKSNNSFLQNKGRDISWKRFLRDSNTGKRVFLKMLMDDPLFDLEKPTDSLADIISGSGLEDWRRYFVERPKILEYLGTDKYIRFLSPQDIQLLQKERLTGTHAEYFSYAFYVKHLLGSNDKFHPFTNVRYVETKGDYLSYCRLSHFEGTLVIDISWQSSAGKFKIEIIDKEEDPLSTVLQAFLKSQGFEEANYYHFSCTSETEEKALRVIKKVCKEFKNENALV